MIANTISGSEFNFFGDGSIERDFTFIEDVVNSVVLLSKQLQKQKPGFSDVVNLGGGTPLSMNYLLEIVGKLSNKDVEFTRRSGSVNDAKKTVSDSTYLQSLIEYKPSTKLADGILRTIEWALLNDIKPNLDSWVKSTQSYDL
jgi:UDP-glucuronate 4-epimerase